MDTPREPPPAGAPVLVLLHGASLNGRMWDPVRRLLAPGWRVVVPDLPGHGRLRHERYTIESAVAAVVAAAESVAPARVILVGDSLGAYTALASAAAVPKARLAGLLLAGATYDFRGAGARAAAVKGRVLRLVAAIVGEDRFIRRSMPKALGPKGFGLSAGDAQALIDAGMSVVAFGQAVAAIRAIDWRGKLAAVDVPTMIANGEEDTINVDQEASFLAVAPRASRYRFARCKHGVSLWRPAEFADLVGDFAGRIARSDGIP